jgi:ectoine hydroxylase-related dioxygenase (phytanoyl-CoA dioxygenase family)
MMTIAERYEFDLRGYIICRNVLSSEEVKRICNILVNIKGAKDDGKFSFLKLDPYFMELMAHPYTLSILQTILGSWLRFDHAFGLKMTKDISISENLHAGPLQNQRAFWYQWVRGQGMHNGLVKVIYALNDVNPGDGGFICVPGSHKGNINYRPQLDSNLVVNPTLKSGDMLIFTEALVHGSKQWIPDRTRIALIYSYAPGFLAWKNYDTIKPYLSLATNDIQRELLRPPYVGDYDEHKAQLTGKWDRKLRAPINPDSKDSVT